MNAVRHRVFVFCIADDNGYILVADSGLSGVLYRWNCLLEHQNSFNNHAIWILVRHAYIGMFFFIPFLNVLIRSIDGRILRKFFLAMLIFASLIPCLTRRDFLVSGWAIIQYFWWSCIVQEPHWKNILRKTTLRHGWNIGWGDGAFWLSEPWFL